ncbi:MAG: crotonase/enoyl-CoA hydratase family protein [Flavobacteriales bacterium]|nr:crotonase/enoyl-CoA hydratase family protein [Flavobacteriales bacterium]
MTFETFEYSVNAGIAHVVLNRPEKVNALNEKAWEELKEIFELVDRTPEVRVAILSGNGKLFSAGIDLQLLMSVKQVESIECPGRRSEQIMKFVKQLQAPVNAIENCSKPVIAAIHNGCIGGALDIIAACDLRYCTDDAYFTIKEIDMGMVADLGTLQRLPKFVKPAAVAEMAFTGKKVAAIEAKQIGLVNDHFADKETLMSETVKIAQLIASKSPLSIRGTKEVLRFTRDHSVEDGLHHMAIWNAAMLMSDDLNQAFISAMTKQPAQFKD